MNSVALWLLVTFSATVNNGGGASVVTSVIDRFDSGHDCREAAEAIRSVAPGRLVLACVPAKVYR